MLGCPYGSLNVHPSPKLVGCSCYRLVTECKMICDRIGGDEINAWTSAVQDTILQDDYAAMSDLIANQADRIISTGTVRKETFAVSSARRHDSLRTHLTCQDDTIYGS